MVKSKSRYYMIRAVYNNVMDSSSTTIRKYDLFQAIMEQSKEMFGDVGYAELKMSLSVRVKDEDVLVLRVAVTAEHYLGAILGCLLSVEGKSVSISTLFIGRSMRSCEKRLIEIRRNELYAALSECTTNETRKSILEALKKCCGKPQRIFEDMK